MRAAVRAKARPADLLHDSRVGAAQADHSAELEAALERLLAAAPATPR